MIKDGIYKRLESSIENVTGICSIINSDLRLGIPANEQDILDNLVSHGILSENMQDLIRKMKGFRNIVVHRYGKIDDKLTFAIISEHINDFELFEDEIRQFLSKNS
uniref:type VII toxin-antitoxin system HepT family RNase toxin n=1 Tax=Methanochimaera problematica TaxID=2609417 RepID=UPI0038CD9E5D